MPNLEWTTTRVGRTKVTHWRKHDARKILEALNRKPVRTIGKTPKVLVHRFGRHELAARTSSNIPRRNAAERVFSVLQQSAALGVAIVEMPVALIHKKGGTTVVTLWKKKTRPLLDFLGDPEVAAELKKRACFSAVRNAAYLHAAGFSHGHLHGGNVVVNKRGEAKLVDPWFLSKPRGIATRGEIFIGESPVSWLVINYKKLVKNDENLYRELTDEYDKWFQTCAERLRKRFKKSA